MPYITPTAPSNDSLTGALLPPSAILPPPSPLTSSLLSLNGGGVLGGGVGGGGGGGSGTGFRPAAGTPPGGGGFVLYMRPLYDRALVDVIRHYKWPKIYYVYDTSEGRISL